MTDRAMDAVPAPLRLAVSGRAGMGYAGAAVLTAALAGALAGPAVAAAGGDPAQSDQTRSMILGPLYEEFAGGAPRQPGAQLAAIPQGGAVRFAPAPAAGHETQSPRPAAAQFAGAALMARSDAYARDRLSAFFGEEAVLASTPSGGRVSVALADGAAPDLAALAFDPEYAAAGGRALTGEPDRTRRMALRYETSFDTRGADGMDYGLAPRAGVSVGGGGAALETGATVRLGRYIDTEFDRPAWWFFAGADRQAVMYDPGQGLDMRDALAMQPYALVGDAQAGVAMRMGGADVSVAYIHRETEFSMPQQSWETSEGFAAFSLTWRR